VAGYSLFNDATVRDFQLRTPQWTMGKNFDGTGSFGPWLVTPDATISVAMNLERGDVIITGTPGGVGAARKPPVFMKAGDIYEVEIEGMGILSNPVEND
jgi:2-keto-4-pentenoate hydratase/2-oxohepta-3-ene-1,7-dioic acid hydratase in catechol pathway